MYNWLVPASINYLFRKQAVKTMLPVEQAMLSRNTMSLMLNLLDEFNANDKNSVTENISPKQVNGYIESLMIFSVAWAFGGVLDSQGRIKFDSFLRALLKGENEDYPRARKIQNPLPRRGSVFDFVWDKKGPENGLCGKTRSTKSILFQRNLEFLKSLFRQLIHLNTPTCWIYQ